MKEFYAGLSRAGLVQILQGNEEWVRFTTRERKALKEENDKLRGENEILKRVLRKIRCGKCGRNHAPNLTYDCLETV